MMYEWDDAKRAINLVKHEVDFTVAEGFDWETVLVRPDLRRHYGEDRFMAFGLVGVRLYAMIFTPRGGRVRIISLRKANEREERDYDRATQA